MTRTEMASTTTENLQQDMCSADPRTALAASRIVEDARDWLADCAWGDMEADDFAALGTYGIVRGVDRFYEGGWAAFARGCERNVST